MLKEEIGRWEETENDVERIINILYSLILCIGKFRSPGEDDSILGSPTLPPKSAEIMFSLAVVGVFIYRLLNRVL
ncbi:hypothetical protein RRG08_046825 [Elysia crispata]|uniref:Uncharacterized protein n=1 Tax=Elysia crispata TaxID=231223 RepID=A0AAE0ZML9_9GAST|nr:hypothetical protein RRG08_046825 [Elysia crispata]